jgi:protein-S-isoprenylcysteine O-methyltransferase Ste14
MAKHGFLKRHGIVRNDIKKDIVQFALPGITVIIIELIFCIRDGLSGFWGIIWGIIKQPQTLSTFSLHNIIGLALFIFGLIIMVVGQITLWRNYSATVVIRKDHKLITHGIYRFTRNPIYLGAFMVFTGLPVYILSLYGFITSLVLIPILLNRIRLEERLLTAEFGIAYQHYKKNVRKLIPFLY